MSDTESPEGWVPAIGHGVTLEEVVERAFDYRGNVTVVKADGTRLEGYVFNRNRDVEVPFVQVFDRDGAGPLALLSADIRTILFTGKDTPAGIASATRVRAQGLS